MYNNESIDIKISGVIGTKILSNRKLKKKIIIFYDDHSNTKYCDKKSINNNLFISELFDELSNKNVAMILEEPLIESDSKIKILWENSKHLFLFRKFYAKLMTKCSNEKICKLFPIDIRLSIFDISPDEIIMDVQNEKKHDKYNIYDTPVNTYFRHICYLFDLNKSKVKTNSICIFIKKVFDVYKNSELYKFTKKRISEFIEKHKIHNTDTNIYEMFKEKSTMTNFIYEKGYPFISNNNDSFIDELDKISSAIMELYSIILILLLPNKNIIFYAGYYHSNNIAYILEKYYNFEEKHKIGITDEIEKNYTKVNDNCVKINKKYLNLIT